MPTILAVPDDVAMQCDRLLCSHCQSQVHAGDITAAGVREIDPDLLCFFFETTCKHCKHSAITVVRARPLSRRHWVAQLHSWLEQGAYSGPIPDLETEWWPHTVRPEWRIYLPLQDRGPVLHKAQRDSIWPVPSPIPVHGGYRCAETGVIMLMVRQVLPWTPPFDTHVKVESRNRIRFAHVDADLKLPPEDWPQFMRLPDGATFRLGGKTWTKMSRQEIDAVVGGRQFIHASSRGKRRKT